MPRRYCLIIAFLLLLSPSLLWSESPDPGLILDRLDLGKVYYQPNRNIYVAEFHSYFRRAAASPGESFKTHRFEAVHRHDSSKETMSRRPKDMLELKVHPYAQLLWPQGAELPQLRIGPKTWSVSFLVQYGPGKGAVYRGQEGELVLVWHSNDPDLNLQKGPQWFFINTTSGSDFFYLNEQGFEAYQAGDLLAAAELFLQSHLIHPDFRFSGFNLLCTRALLGQSWRASQDIILSVLASGSGQSRFRAKVQEDADLAAWRQDPAFLDFLSGL